MRPDDTRSTPPPGDTPQERYAELQARLGHAFRNATLCETAMTHTSWLNEAGQPDRSDNERLEFLGDAVLDLVVSDLLMRRFPDRREGDLSRARAALVSESGLAQVALDIDLGRFILLGKGEERTGGRTRPSILANGLEALMGAIYVDAGFDAAAAVASRLFEGRIQDVDAHARFDFKSRLQERAQALWQTAPVYEVVAEEGPDHDKRFVVALSLGGRSYGRAVGRSKKEAEQGAAAAALDAIDAIDALEREGKT
jgi:ribonuclease III